MHKGGALRVLHLLSLLPSALASMLCYDSTSAMHPGVRTPVDCWPPSQRQTTRRSPGDALLNGYGNVAPRELHIRVNEDGGYPPYSPIPSSAGPASGHPTPYPTPPPGHGSHDHRGSPDQDYDADLDQNSANLPFFDWAPRSPLSEILAYPALPPPTWNSSQQIFFHLQCNVSPEFCCNMSNTLDIAGWYVSQVSSKCYVSLIKGDTIRRALIGQRDRR